jgi:hypothetical protein
MLDMKASSFSEASVTLSVYTVLCDHILKSPSAEFVVHFRPIHTKVSLTILLAIR